MAGAAAPATTTPTYASWLNQVERWFGIITQQAIRRGSFSSVSQLRKRIDEFVENYNRNCRPFAWTATADSILAKVEPLAYLFPGRHTSSLSDLPLWRQDRRGAGRVGWANKGLGRG